MIPKASQRGGGQQLATHLLSELENDRVEGMEVRGAVAMAHSPSGWPSPPAPNASNTSTACRSIPILRMGL